jgi:hypothetical protein
MKILLLSLIFSFTSHAVTLEKYLSLPEGSMKQMIMFDKNEVRLFKDSNYFDAKRNYAIGNFTTPSNQEKIRKSLDDLLKKIETVDDALKKQGTSFNELSIPKAHVTIYRLDNFVIGPGSKYFKDLDKHFNTLSALNWQQLDGYEISKDMKTVKEYEKGKVKLTKEYASDFYCKNDVCSYFGGGQVFK